MKWKVLAKKRTDLESKLKRAELKLNLIGQVRQTTLLQRELTNQETDHKLYRMQQRKTDKKYKGRLRDMKNKI